MKIATLLNDYRKLESNEFWKALQDSISGKAQGTLERLGKETSLPENKLRFLQGFYAALADVIELPHSIADELRKTIEGNPEGTS